MALLFAFTHAGDLPAGPVQIRLDRLRLDTCLQVDLLALTLDEIGGEGCLALAARQLGLQRPVLDWNERLDFALAIDDHAHRHGLHSAGGQAATNLASEESADRVADQAIDDTASLLGIDPVHVDGARVLQGVQDRAAGDFVKLDTADVLVTVQA